MTLLGGWTRSRRAVASSLAVALLASVPVGLAIAYEGFPVSEVELDSRDVWVTNGEESLAGRLNRQIDELTAGARTAGTDIDVLQDARTVLLHDRQADTLERIDQARSTLIERTELPAGARLGLGKQTLAVLDPATGSLWVVDVANELSFDPAASEPDLELGDDARVVVGRDGVVHATAPEDGLLYRIDGPGFAPIETAIDLPREHELTVVGDVAVMLDESADLVVTGEGRRIELEHDALRLQQPSDARDEVVIATGDGVIRVPLGGGEVEAIEATTAVARTPEQVAAPVQLEGCIHAAFPEGRAYLYACDDVEPATFEIEQPTSGARLEFRVNRSVIALNNLLNGNTWVLESSLRLVDNWDEITPPQLEESEEGDEESSEESFEDTLAERTEENRPPIARPDEYGVRAGRTTILPVLDNDTDPDGDVLVITGVSPVPETVGRIDLIDGGRALQFTPSPTAAGGASFRYTVSDGRSGGVAESTVGLAVTGPDANGAPEQIRSSKTSVEAGQSVTYSVLPNFRDPDGDELFLDSASATTADEVSFTPDGFIAFRHRSGELGAKTVSFVVSDGRSSASGELEVEVVAAGSLTPIGTPDYAEVIVGDTVVVEPLLNDVSPSGAALELLSVDEVPDSATVELNAESGRISVSPTEPGAIYLKYALGAGPATSIGLIRIEARPRPDEPLAPIAVKDVAYLRAGEPTSVRVLANDVSPTGSVLAVQSVSTESTAAGVSVELLNNTVIRITATAAVTEQTQVSYTISDGAATATAGVTVVPVPPIVNRQPPLAVDDRRTVRAGDVASIPVLDNDVHPDRARIVLEPELADVEGAGEGLAFTQGDALRFQAPDEPGEYSVVYRIADQYGETATATATFVVTPRDIEGNQPPVLAQQTARTFAGSSVRIDVPLDDVDPDGDSVVLSGLAAAPGLGAIVETGPTWFVYEAYANSRGTDRFSYEVTDALGGASVGEIVVGVVPRPELQAQPSAVDDRIQVRPGRTASVEVLLNDSDPNGYPLRVSRELLEVDDGLEAEVDGSKVIVTAPDVEGGYALRYEMTNGNGGVDSAFVQVEVTSSAEIPFPTAEDYYVLDSELDGTDPVEVDVRALIGNPNGRDSDLLISTVGPESARGAVAQTEGLVTVTPGGERYAVAYRVTDPEDESLTATAFIIVPAVATDEADAEVEVEQPPYLRTDLGQQVVEMNGEIQWDLADIVVVPTGRPPILTGPEGVRASDADASGLVVDDDTIRYAPAVEFRGQASIVFEVTDGASGDDPEGNTALLTLPITVGDPEFRDAPPEFTALALEIEAGEASQTVDLRDSTAHPNRAVLPEVAYSGLSAPTNGIAAGLAGSQLTVSAPFGVQPGASTTLTVELRYRDFVVPGTISVTVVASQRPPAQAVTDEAKGQRSVTSTVEVLGNDFNPFAGEPLEVIDAFVENGAETSASVRFTPQGEITVNPDASFIGVVSVVYTVQDVTKDPSRHVQGRLLLTVRDVPSQPAPAAIVSEQDQAVVLGWQAPATNGEPILDYTITWSGGSTTVGADVAQTTIGGLANGTAYTFRISARNVLGSSTVSQESATARPFGTPSAPGSVSISGSSNGSGSLSFSWSAANGNGRDVAQYEWRLSDGQTGRVSGSTLSAGATGSVGQRYTVDVVAIGPSGLQGAPQRSANAATPEPAAPNWAEAAVGSRGDRTVTLTWGNAPSTSPIDRYEINISENGSNWGWQRVGSDRRHTFQGGFGSNYRFQVRAVDNGATGASTTSNTVTPLDVLPPPAPSATIFKGGPSPYAPCCNSVGIDYENFTPGNYRITTFLDGSNGGLTDNVYSLNANGSRVIDNALGTRRDAEIRVRIVSVATGQVFWSRTISGTQWNNLRAR